MYDYNFARRNDACRQAELRRYHLECMITCLEASLKRVNPRNELQQVMAQLDAATAEMETVLREIVDLRYQIAVEGFGRELEQT